MLEKIFTFFTLLSQSCFSAIKVLFQSRYFVKLPAASSKTCYILVNGPSLKESVGQYQEQLKGKTLFTVNSFSSTDYHGLLKPQNHVIVDPSFWEEVVPPKLIEHRAKTFDDLVKNTHWPITFFVPKKAYQSKVLQAYIGKNPNITFFPFNNTPIEGFQKLNHLLFKWNLGMPRPHNVLIPCIMLAINMKFEKIVLLGADHSWLPTVMVSDDNNVFLTEKHFYNPKNANKSIMYEKRVRPKRLFEVLFSYMVIFRGYFIIQDYAKDQNVSVLNATPNSFIDAFERVDLKQTIA